MKTIYTIIIASIVSLVTFYGISQVTTQAVSLGNMDNESINIIGMYDTQLNDYINTYNSTNISTSEPDVSKDDDFFKEYSDLKTRFDLIKDAGNLAYKIPGIIFVSLTFLDHSDVVFYSHIIWFIIGLLIALAFYKGLKTGEVDGK